MSLGLHERRLAEVRRMLDRCIGDDSETMIEDVALLGRAVVLLRDGLIAERRAGTLDAAHDCWLPQVNAVLSAVVGSEFPVHGTDKGRLKAARKTVAALKADPAATS